MSKDEVIKLIEYILEKQGKETNNVAGSSTLRELQFRSLDFSELCLRVEEQKQTELNFEAAALRGLETVDDVCSFIMEASK